MFELRVKLKKSLKKLIVKLTKMMKITAQLKTILCYDEVERAVLQD